MESDVSASPVDAYFGAQPRNAGEHKDYSVVHLAGQASRGTFAVWGKVENPQEESSTAGLVVVEDNPETRTQSSGDEVVTPVAEIHSREPTGANGIVCQAAFDSHSEQEQSELSRFCSSPTKSRTSETVPHGSGKVSMSLEGENKRLTKENKALTEENTTLVEANTSLKGEKMGLVEANTTLTKACTSLEGEKMALVEENTTLTEENMALVEVNTALTKANTSLIDEKTALAEQNATLTEERESLIGKAQQKDYNCSVISAIVTQGELRVETNSAETEFVSESGDEDCEMN